MTFKPALWYPIATVLSVVNVAATWFAAAATEPMHATIHAGFAAAFAVWAERLRRARRESELEPALGPLELEVSELRQALMETQERLDFTERVLAQGRDPRRADAEGQER